MQCSECKKRPATLHLTQYINGSKKEIHVCELCAQKKGYMQQQEDPYSLHELLSGLFNFGPSQIELQSSDFFDQVQTVECSKCHSTFDDFKRIGKFGCAECYDSFQDKIDSIFRKVHSGNTRHHGKIPKRKGQGLHKQREIAHYREKLQQLIASEQFEQAAIIRDKIKNLEQNEMGDDA